MSDYKDIKKITRLVHHIDYFLRKKILPIFPVTDFMLLLTDFNEIAQAYYMNKPERKVIFGMPNIFYPFRSESTLTHNLK